MMPFLFNEDRALKLKLSGLRVIDATSGAGRPVAVRFRNPEYELADATFPLALIEHVRVAKADEREMRGPIRLHYAPEGMPGWDDMADPTGSPYLLPESPIPLNVEYQADVFARKMQHLINLVGQLAGFHRLPPRFGYLAIPEDGTVRRLDLLGGPEYSESTDRDGKRLFVASWSIRISAELLPEDIVTLTEVQRVLLDFELLPSRVPVGN